jgi:hypothetical protein
MIVARHAEGFWGVFAAVEAWCVRCWSVWVGEVAVMRMRFAELAVAWRVGRGSTNRLEVCDRNPSLSFCVDAFHVLESI